MKRSKSSKLDQPYKKNAGIFAEIKLLFILIGLLALLALVEHSSLVISSLRSIEIKKALAIDEVKDVKILMSSTPPPLESITPTPSVTYQQLAKNDFCLNVPILMYHHVQPMQIAVSEGHGQLTVDSNTFDAHMEYLLGQGYKMVSTVEIVNAVFSHQELPAKSIAITVDDGYKDNYEYAYQTAKKYNIKMDFMIPTGLIGNPGYMTWDDLLDMSRNSLVTIYNHTWSHASMGIGDRAAIEQEIMTAQKQLEENLGIKNPVFVYPYGLYSPLAIEVLKEKGFTAAVTTIQGTLQCESAIMEMQRTRIGNTDLSFYGF